MAPGPTQLKRQRERARDERRKQKEARRQASKADVSRKTQTPTGEDPDLAGIRPGPQPLADWQRDLDEV